MWDVRERRENGQLILVGALSLAIVLVGIALVLNASIYAENLATRANQQESGQIVTLEREAAQGAGVAMEHLHHDLDSHTSYSSLESDFDDAINNWSDWTVRDSAREGQYVDVDYTGTYTQGTRITQDDGGQFLPRDPDSGVLGLDIDIDNLEDSWVVTPDSSRVRDFSMTVDRSQVGGGTLTGLEAEAVGTVLLDLDLSGSVDLGPLSVSEAPFTTAYDVDDDGTLDHSFAIYRSTTGSEDINITYANYVTGATRTCTIEDADPTFTVDVSNGRVEGGDGDCHDVFGFQSEMTSSQMMFLEGDQIGGNYEFVVNEPVSTFDNDYESLLSLLGLTGPSFEDFYAPHPDDSDHDSTYDPDDPYVEPAIYSAEVGLDYRSDSMSYESTVTVAPNEP
jgi:hypothetical protein